VPRTPRKKAEDALLLALACGATVEQAARQCGLSDRTVYRRLADPGFKRRLQGVRADFVQRTAGTMTAAGTEAVRTLLELLKPAAPPPVRLGAAKAVLEIGLKVREVAEFEERMTALEQRLDAGEAARRR
jgi:hypothetical protein